MSAIGVGQVKAATAAVCGVTVRELEGPSRERAIVRPRQIAMFVATESCGLSLPQIGSAFGRDHTTVIHAVKAVRERPKCLAAASRITEQLSAHTSLAQRVRIEVEMCRAIADGLRAWGGVLSFQGGDAA